MFELLLLCASLIFTPASTTTTFPTTINVYVISPISNYDYAPVNLFPLSFGIENALVAEWFSFSLIYTIQGYAECCPSSEPLELDTGALFSNTISPNSSTYIWDTSSDFSEVGNWTLIWDFQMSSCVVTENGEFTEYNYTFGGTVASGAVNFTMSANGGLADVRSCSTDGGSYVIATNSSHCAELGNPPSSASPSVCTITVSMNSSTSSSVVASPVPSASPSANSGTTGISPTTTSTETTSTSATGASANPSKSSENRERVTGGLLGLMMAALCVILVQKP